MKVAPGRTGAVPIKRNVRLLAAGMALAGLWWSAAGSAAEANVCQTMSRGSVRDATSPKSAWSTAPVYEGAGIADAGGLAALPRPAIVVDVNLPGADFSQVDLSGLCFAGGDLSQSRWSHADGVALIGVDVSGADWRSANLSGALLIDSDLDAVDAEGVQLDDASIAGGSLGMILANAHMDRTYIRCGTGMLDGNQCESKRRSNLSGAEFTSANFKGSLPPGWKLASARLIGITIDWGNIDSLAGVKLQGATIVTSSGFLADRRAHLSPEEVALTVGQMSWIDEGAPLSKRSPSMIKRAGQLLYVDSDSSSASFRRTALWRRLLPVIASSARSWLTVLVLDARHVRVRATSIDDRGKMCDIGIDGAEVLERGKDDWYDRTVRTSDPDLGDNRGRLVRFSADQVEFQRYEADCASNTGWGNLRYLTNDPALINSVSQ